MCQQSSRELGCPSTCGFAVAIISALGNWEVLIFTPQALVDQIYRQCGRAPFVILSLLHSHCRSPELAPALLASGEANCFPLLHAYETCLGALLLLLLEEKNALSSLKNIYSPKEREGNRRLEQQGNQSKPGVMLGRHKEDEQCGEKSLCCAGKCWFRTLSLFFSYYFIYKDFWQDTEYITIFTVPTECFLIKVYATNQ